MTGRESIHAHGLRVLGGARWKAQLAASPLQGHVASVLPPEFTDASALDYLNDLWPLLARPSQLPPPGLWRTAILLGGRGAGKTRAGCEWLLDQVDQAVALVEAGRLPPAQARLGLIAATAADCRDTCVEGASGILASMKPWLPGDYQPANRKVSFRNGVEIHLFSAEEPDRLRGPNLRAILAEEFCAWRFQDAAYSNALFALRLGDSRALIATTPRPSKLLRQILDAPSTVVMRSTTADNRANLSEAAIDELYRLYEHTRLGRAELFGEVLEDNPSALWKVGDIDGPRVTSAPELRRIVIAVDPAVTSREGSDETGIIVVGVGECRCTGKSETHAFVLEDLSGIFSPDRWARRIVEAFHRHKADRVVGEVNQGGDLIENTLRTIAPTIPFTGVNATRGKQVRAEPIAALYEQHRVHHVGHFPALETQLVQWNPLVDRWSPDRLDALCWGLTALDFSRRPPPAAPTYDHDPSRPILPPRDAAPHSAGGMRDPSGGGRWDPGPNRGGRW